MYVCLCRAATDTDVREAISAGADTVEEVGRLCGAGTGCGSCHEMVKDLIKSNRGRRSLPMLATRAS